jgi:pimeloyl-ACP methyl ester carboxylesterase
MGGASMALFAGDLAALAEDLGPPVVVGGISMGAALSLRLAVLRPDLVRGLILVRPAWIADPAPPNMASVAEVADFLRRFGPAEGRARFLSSSMARRLSAEAPDNLSSLLGYFDRPREGLAHLLATIASDGPGVTEEQIAALRIPCLVCGTREDLIHPFAMAEGLASLISGARFVELLPKGRDRTAHFASLRAAMDEFVAGLAG